jgi:8-oxo-dGTP pyrophosphatase MutT (NUDIX family)
MKDFAPPQPEDLRRLLSGFDTLLTDTAGVLQAAVLILICASDENIFIPLTLRSKDLPVHAGQVCLPGGRVSSTDSCLEMTAVREAREEIGVKLELSNVLGCLPATRTNSGFEVTPVVAWIYESPVFQLEPNEVSELIALPLELVLDLSQYKQDSIIENGVERTFCYMEFGGFRIWGATARILHSLAHLVRTQ